MSHPLNHAIVELALIGQDAEDPAFTQSILAAISAFESYGHSGASHEIGVDMLTRLLRRENLSPLTDEPTEWTNRSEESGYALWQNNRNPSCFSEDGGLSYYDLSEDRHDDAGGLVRHFHRTAPSEVEPDESVEDLLAAFAAGEQGQTSDWTSGETYAVTPQWVQDELPFGDQVLGGPVTINIDLGGSCECGGQC